MNERDLARLLEHQGSDAEERAFLKAVDADPRLRADVVAHVRLSVRLHAACHPPQDRRLVERTQSLLGARDRGQRTLETLQRRIGGRARARQWTGWAIAAGLLLAVLALATFRPGRPEVRTEVGVRTEPRTAPEPRPTPPEEAPLPKPPTPVEAPKPPPEPIVPKEQPKVQPLPPADVRPQPPPPPTAPPPPKPEPPRLPVETKVAVARIESSSGEAFLSGGRKALRPGQDLFEGEGVHTGASSAIVIEFPDKTRIDLGPNTTLRALFNHDSPAPGARGKRLLLDKGSLRAQVVKQPANQPMDVLTPHAEARVLGTTLQLLVGDRKDGATRLEVSEGKVQFKPAGEGKAVDVGAGHYAVAAPGVDPVPYANPVLIDLNDFGTGRDVKPAAGPVRRLYRDVSLLSTGGTCIAAPGVGTSLEGALPVAPGAWFLWIRFRDTDQGPVSFQVEVDGKTAETIVGEGFLKKQPLEKWNWRRVSFETKAKLVRLTLRSTSDALKFDKSNDTYVVVNRWDSILLTRDPHFDPEKTP